MIYQFPLTEKMRYLPESHNLFSCFVSYVRSLTFANIDLSWPPDFIGSTIQLLFPVCKPSCNTGDRKQNSSQQAWNMALTWEKIKRESHGLVDQSRPEIDIRIKFP